MAFTSTYEDSDADDEYERSVTSPPMITDSETSPTDSDPPSAENTPTTYGNLGDDKSPRTIITEWTAEECADYVSSLGLSQYADAFLENEIVGEALVALKHEELKEMGIASVGHRLTLLKSVYDIKTAQDIPVDSEHYVPLSADAGMQDAIATQEDIARIIQSIKIRDERIVQAEQQLRKVTEEYRKLREELLPVFRMAKDKSQPLPIHPAGSGNDGLNHEQVGIISQSQMQAEPSVGLSRKFSHKKFFLGSTPKNSSPTYIPSSIQENKHLADGSMIDPSLAAVTASNHLNASVIGGTMISGAGAGGSQSVTSPGQPSIPSPTARPPHGNQSGQSPLIPRSYNQPPSSHKRLTLQHEEPPPYSQVTVNSVAGMGRDRGNSGQAQPTPRSAGHDGSTPEIFKTFKVSMDDPCYKVLPAALEKYNINADWKQYALYIVYGDEERCLELEEKPLILFKQLNSEGRKPTFMLRKIAVAMDGQHPGAPPGTLPGGML